MSNYSENEIIPVALNIIKNQPGITTSELISEVRKIMKPDGDDLTILANRNDDKFSQKVRNLKSHDSILTEVITIGQRNRKWYLK